MRGGHPEQREPGGGWGLTGRPEPGAPAPGARPRRPAHPQERPPSAPVGHTTGTSPLLHPAGARSALPRQEYLDAFDDEDAFTPRATPRGVSEGAATSGGDAGTGAPTSTLTKGAAGGGGPGAPGLDGAASDGGRPGGSARRRTPKGRAFTGIAAAAVTTVLAVVVAGQVTDARHRGDAQAAAKNPAGRPAADPRAKPVKKPAAAPLTYDELMARVYPLSPTLKGGGAFETVPGFDKAPGKGELMRYRVDVEKGLGLDGKLFALAVQKTLNDRRSWAHDGARTFERVSSGSPDFVITLASPGTTAVWCAKSGLDTTEDNVSCDSAATDRVMINAYRWAQGATTYGDALIHPYRQMLINHEVGHRLGLNHVTCSRQGALAPVMQQQTKFLTYDGITCKPNPWPYPHA